MRRFVIGDIHGNYRALKQVLERSEFDYEEDLLVSLGDVADGWSQTRQCVDELLKIKNLKAVRGNHDKWTLTWINTGIIERMWYNQGGAATVDSYNKSWHSLPNIHKEFFRNQIPYCVLDANTDKPKLFVHGGFTHRLPIALQSEDDLMWDRDFYYIVRTAIDEKCGVKKGDYTEVYIGHTSVQYEFKTTDPVIYDGVHLLDTGAGWDGKLTLMDIDTKEYWQSDLAKELYPEDKGRFG